MVKSRGLMVCTICSGKKNTEEGLLPAVQRYRSRRIARVYRLARRAGIPCAILSGKFGLIRAEERIPYYDLLLKKAGIPALRKKIAAFLRRHSIRRVFFLLPDPADDPKVIPYLESLRRGARAAGAALVVRFVPPYPRTRDLSAAKR